ncbi:17686_t:CDS:10 [Gigaspora margarita]|uniref:17686_t:CDS:1 n=1 Tax=Gigaspora margarita TaxID=4874 RepID=A0ABN7UG52_GIGMA|nr:17686_t:CDS:10 [Gigaspora margarita]
MSKKNPQKNRRENPFSTPIGQKPSLTSLSSLDSYTSQSSSNLNTPSKIIPGSNSNEMDHVLYFDKPYSEWKLIKFLKRKKYKQAQQDTNWKDEYETYERHISLIFDEKTRTNLYHTYLEDKGSNEVKKFWSGWCQQYAKSDKNKILPEAQDFLDDVLKQKSTNWESLENQKQKSNNKLPSGRTIEDSLQDAIIQIQEKDSYYNYEIFSNIINTNDNDIKTIFSIEDIDFLNASQKIPSFTFTSSQVNYIRLLIDNDIKQPIERANIFEKITGLTPYIKCVIRGFFQILNHEIIVPFDTSINENTWTIKVLSIFIEPLLDSVPNIKISWPEHYSDASKARMNIIKKNDEERQGHKVDFDVMWQDYLKKEKWEVIVGEFSGKPFEPLLDKCYKDKCKLFRCMKDILDLRISKISKFCNAKINNEIYDIIQTMQVFGIHSHRTTLDIYVLNKPFLRVYVVSLWCSLAVPYRKSKGFQDHIHNLIEKLWAYLKDGVVDEILKIIKICELSTTIRDSSYTRILQNSHAITIVSPIKYQRSN